MIECLALGSQLAQVVLYGAAGVSRERTGNLWMRRCMFSSVPDDAAGRQARLTVSKFARFQRAGVDQVSAVVQISAFPGWRGEASLAFQVHG
ncbi:AvrD family protein [Leifsonia xyli]|uniref:AvrD family protein n=1 Tax=Leifsonia xyli TaxID=1575 RepID=UPI003D6743B0